MRKVLSILLFVLIFLFLKSAIAQNGYLGRLKRELTKPRQDLTAYVRLACHGYRAEQKGFSAISKTAFDNSVGKVSIMPQEVGRVLLNLFNKTIYAVHEKMKTLDGDNTPTLMARTKKRNDSININVQDKGMGISKSFQDKIFQPLFTTKSWGARHRPGIVYGLPHFKSL